MTLYQLKSLLLNLNLKFYLIPSMVNDQNIRELWYCLVDIYLLGYSLKVEFNGKYIDLKQKFNYNFNYNTLYEAI